MSRIGKLPIPVPTGTEVKVNGQTVSVKGSKGQQEMTLTDLVTPELRDGEVAILPRADLAAKAEKYREDTKAKGKREPTFAEALDQNARTQWGTARAQVANMVHGVSQGFEKTLEIQGVGYRAQMQGRDIKLSLGFSHDVIYSPPEGVELKATKPTEIVVSGIDKQAVGQVAAEIRAYRPPEPYKGKGVRYANEFVRRKEGKKK